MQQTLQTDISCTGIGLHSGAVVNLRLRPALAEQGIVFVRTDLGGDNVIPALYDRVVDTRLCTVIANAAGATVGTIEHLMAALRGCGVDNVIVEVDGPEVPIMDGSAAAFVAIIEEAGLRALAQPRRAIKILREIIIEDGGRIASLSPADDFIFGGAIEFAHPSIGCQEYETTLVNGNFRHDIASARTFGFAHEVEMMRKAGLARGGSLDNAIVLSETAVLNQGGLRFENEFIRHKLLDAIGDLYLAGGPILGAYDGYKAGHAMNNTVLRKLFATPGAWAWVDLPETGEAAKTPKTPLFVDKADKLIAA